MDLQHLSDVDLLTACIWAEARGEPLLGKVAVCNVVQNRAAGGKTIHDVILAPRQFSWTDPNDPNYQAVLYCLKPTPVPLSQWATSATIARLALAGCFIDMTGGANHYLNIELTKTMRHGTLPSWVDETKVTVKIGNHTFLRL